MPSPSSPPSAPALSRRLWVLFALFVLYGTTIPFNFAIDRDILHEHLSHVSANPFISSETGQRLSGTDAVQNILLFLPFGVLGMLSARPGAPRARRILFVTLLGAALSATVETLQLFTRDRITSTSDVMTNAMGAFFGAMAANSVGLAARRVLRGLTRAGLVDHPSFYPMLVATIVVCLGAWEPFDATLDVGSVFSKLKMFRADVWQYSGLNDEGVAFVTYVLFAVASCRWLEELGSTGAAALTAAVGVALAFALEGSQLFIGSRMPGLEDAVVRAAGILVGVVLWSRYRHSSRRTLWLTLIAVGVAAGAAMQMLNPFQVTSQHNPFQWLPFMNYYEVTTFSTLSHALELLLIYFPLGFCFALAWPRSPRTLVPTVVLTVLAIAAPIEYAQGWIVGRFPDVTDPALSAVGGWIGAWVGSRGAAMFSQAVARQRPAARTLRTAYR